MADDPVQLLPAAPNVQLAEVLDGLDGVNIYSAPRAGQYVAPMVVIRPDGPWIEPDTFQYDRERWLAIVAVGVASYDAGLVQLYDIVRAVIDLADGAGWAFTETAMPILDESTGTAFLAAAVRLTYRHCRAED